MKNKWELAREISLPVKREVRQRCGFGCIVCGKALIEYHHSTIKYSEAQEHNPNEIVLLCGGCHTRVTRGWLSDEAINEAAQNPKCLESGYSFEAFDVGQNNIEVFAGTLKAINTTTLIRVFGQPILCIDQPENENAPFRISAIFCDKYGQESLIIEENEWQLSTQNWDAEVVGTKITIRHAPRDIVLRLRTEARKAIIIEKLNMRYENVQVICEENKQISVKMPDGRYFQTVSATIQNCEVGIDITESGIQIGSNCKKAHFENLKVSSR